MTKHDDRINEIVEAANAEGRELSDAEKDEIVDEISQLDDGSDSGCREQIVVIVGASGLTAASVLGHLLQGWIG